MNTNILYFGDNLEILQNNKYFPDECIDLIYLDPPFSSNRDYNVLYREASGKWSEAQIKAFSDTWTWDKVTDDTLQDIRLKAPLEVGKLIEGMVEGIGKNPVSAYLVMMTPRLLEMYRVLKDTGSLYLHCDPTASHYLKLILDRIFGTRNFRNEILWTYRTGGASKRHFARKHDTIFFYSKSNTYLFNPQKERIYYDKPFFSPQKDSKGRYYADVFVRDCWEIPAVINVSKERLGYATQKPLALLERIVRASSNEGDIVLDPFCGCGTALVAAHKLNRRWIGIDITYIAIEVMSKRLKDSFSGISFETEGLPKDIDGAKALARKSRTQFELWAIGLVGGKSVGRRDGGVDGIIDFQEDAKTWARIAVQVKSGVVNPGLIRDLEGVLANQNYPIGIFITLNAPTRGMNDEARKAGHYCHPFFNLDYPKLQILTIEELLQGKKPDIPPTQVQVFPKVPTVTKEEGEQLQNL